MDHHMDILFLFYINTFCNQKRQHSNVIENLVPNDL